MKRAINAFSLLFQPIPRKRASNQIKPAETEPATEPKPEIAPGRSTGVYAFDTPDNAPLSEKKTAPQFNDSFILL